MKNIFTKEVSNEVIGRIRQLSPASGPQWGKMNVAQMLAHCSVTYEMVYDNIHPKAGGFKKFLLKLFVKQAVVSEKPYKQNSPTSPEFKVPANKEFQKEQERLIAYIERTQALGSGHFEGKESNSFGALSAAEWNNMMYKHLDHHLRQFGV